MNGSDIFNLDGDDLNTPCSMDKVKVRSQHTCGVSKILFGEVEAISPRKPTSIPEVAKQRELSGTLEAPIEETTSRKPTSTSKVRELVGSDIFGPPPEVVPKFCHNQGDEGIVTSLKDLALNTSRIAGSTLVFFGNESEYEVSAKKRNSHKVAELSGHDIFKDDSPKSVSDKHLSAAKRKEITGSNIFADEKPVLREHYAGIRKPPGGGSSLTLV
ncbi:hypothetical protein KP509_01G061200 [Ceratopteris richardii]|nr:hypothetical protein KP509_01G061200 [Ceratopteris richardii]